jgi:hypothetical protein
MDILDFSIDRRRSTWENRGYVSKTVVFETCFLKEMLKKDVGLQYLLIYLVSLIGTFGASPEPDAMHPKVLRPTNDPVSTQL